MIGERAPDESFTSHLLSWLALWLRRHEINVLIFRVRPVYGWRLTDLESRG
jgi:hypothetical protein